MALKATESCPMGQQFTSPRVEHWLSTLMRCTVLHCHSIYSHIIVDYTFGRIIDRHAVLLFKFQTELSFQHSTRVNLASAQYPASYQIIKIVSNNIVTTTNVNMDGLSLLRVAQV